MSIIDQFLAKFEKDIYSAFGPRKYGTWFKGIEYMQQIPTDKREVCEMILVHNHKVRAYNRLGGQLGRLIQGYTKAKVLATTD
jgi:hypothetical protein